MDKTMLFYLTLRVAIDHSHDNNKKKGQIKQPERQEDINGIT